MRSIPEILGREPLPLITPPMSGRVIAVTGAHGFIGTELCRMIDAAGGQSVPLDLPAHDIMRPRSIAWNELDPEGIDAIVHLAAHKDAPMGELIPADVADVNIRGTANMVDLGPPVILASTCKAADPCTAYGASKLVAERVALNARGGVVRLVNVVASSASVLQRWEDLPDDEPLPVADALRMWMDVDEACKLLLTAVRLRLDLALPLRIAPSGLYATTVADMAARAYPGRPQVSMPLRRGDREVERLVAETERGANILPGVMRIMDAWEAGLDVKVYDGPLVETA